ncbi:MAG: Mur ligase family protein, partial [Oscillospiraceae bacterium]|nr:Mur ligase family protein [Oscillospiraceae bacterium]
MPEWFPVIIIAVFAGSAVTASLTCIHMMQLASYQTPGYWRWLKRSGGDYFARQWPAAVIPLLGLIEHWASWAAACAALVLLAVFNIPKKAKKPFVLTPRAARIFAVQIILTAALGAGIFIPVHRVAVSSLAVSYLMIPLLVILSNWITLPVQRVINKRFTNDAKRCLASMSELVVIGVTGSYGKTSMKYILTKLLSERYETLMTPGSYNTAMGVVRTV